MDGFACDCYCGHFHENTTELPRSLATPPTDCEGNSEWSWLERVEEVARRPTVPVWPGWDRGQKPPLPPTAPVQPAFPTSQSRATAAETQLRYASAPFAAKTKGFSLDQDGNAKRPEKTTNQKMQGLDPNPQVEESGTDADVPGRPFHMAADNLSWISAGLEGFGNVEESPGNDRRQLHSGRCFLRNADPFYHKKQHKKKLPFVLA